MYCYSDDEGVGSNGKPFNPAYFDANAKYAEHFGNSLLLNFLLQGATMVAEKAQITKELGKAERKMKYWERQENYSLEEVTPLLMKERRKWR